MKSLSFCDGKRLSFSFSLFLHNSGRGAVVMSEGLTKRRGDCVGLVYDKHCHCREACGDCSREQKAIRKLVGVDVGVHEQAVLYVAHKGELSFRRSGMLGVYCLRDNKEDLARGVEMHGCDCREA